MGERAWSKGSWNTVMLGLMTWRNLSQAIQDSFLFVSWVTLRWMVASICLLGDLALNDGVNLGTNLMNIYSRFAKNGMATMSRRAWWVLRARHRCRCRLLGGLLADWTDPVIVLGFFYSVSSLQRWLLLSSPIIVLHFRWSCLFCFGLFFPPASDSMSVLCFCKLCLVRGKLPLDTDCRFVCDRFWWQRQSQVFGHFSQLFLDLLVFLQSVHIQPQILSNLGDLLRFSISRSLSYIYIYIFFSCFTSLWNPLGYDRHAILTSLHLFSSLVRCPLSIPYCIVSPHLFLQLLSLPAPPAFGGFNYPYFGQGTSQLRRFRL